MIQLLPDPEEKPEANPNLIDMGKIDQVPEESPNPNPVAHKPLFHLADRYRAALIGHTVSGCATPRFAYSLTRLVACVEELDKVGEDEAMHRIMDMIIHIEMEKGNLAPVFVDDAATQPKRIILPN